MQNSHTATPNFEAQSCSNLELHAALDAESTLKSGSRKATKLRKALALKSAQTSWYLSQIVRRLHPRAVRKLNQTAREHTPQDTGALEMLKVAAMPNCRIAALVKVRKVTMVEFQCASTAPRDQGRQGSKLSGVSSLMPGHPQLHKDTIYPAIVHAELQGRCPHPSTAPNACIILYPVHSWSRRGLSWSAAARAAGAGPSPTDCLQTELA